MAVCADYKIPHSEFLSWDKQDRDKAIWWYLRNLSACPECGTRSEEWDPKQGGHRHAYVAKEKVCPGCVEIQRKRDSLQETSTRGLHIVLRRNVEVLDAKS